MRWRGWGRCDRLGTGLFFSRVLDLVSIDLGGGGVVFPCFFLFSARVY